MMTTVILYILAANWMATLAPGRDHTALAWAVAVNASTEREAALLTAVAFRESSLTNDISGDGGHSVCAMQIYDGSPTLRKNPVACVQRGAEMLRESARVDPNHPVAHYARGPRWQTEEARRISRDRVALAERLLASTAVK